MPLPAMRTSSIPPVGRKDQEAFDSRPKTPDGSTNDSPVSALYQMQVYTHTNHHRRRRPTILHLTNSPSPLASSPPPPPPPPRQPQPPPPPDGGGCGGSAHRGGRSEVRRYVPHRRRVRLRLSTATLLVELRRAFASLALRVTRSGQWRTGHGERAHSHESLPACPPNRPPNATTPRNR